MLTEFLSKLLTFEAIVGNTCNLGAMVTDSISGTRKKQKQILGFQILSQVFYGVGSIILKGYSSTVQNGVAIFRNVAAMLNFRSKNAERIRIAIEVVLIVAGVALGIAFNNRGWLGVLPVAANLEYSLAVFFFKKNEKALKIAFVINMLMFCPFSFAILNIVGGIGNLVVAVTTTISLIKGEKEKKEPAEELPEETEGRETPELIEQNNNEEETHAKN